MTDRDLRYPVGPYTPPATFDAEWRGHCIDIIANTPSALRGVVEGLNDSQLDTPYRPGGWTVRQVVHHVPDSHINAFVRLKLALTEDTPVIRPYNEAAWALLEDARTTPIETSLLLLQTVHDRFTRLWRAMGERDFERRYVHPESGEHTLHYLLGMYAWHGPHHVAHIAALRQREGW